MTQRIPTCKKCRKESWEVETEYDGYGIPLGRWCNDCRDEGMSRFRSDIHTRYETDERIEEDY